MKAFSEEGITFYGGGRTRSGGWDAWSEDAYPDLAIGPVTELGVNTRVPLGWACSEHLPTFIEIEWPDMRTPRVPPAFWTSLVEDIRAKDQIRTVQAQCMGGHGRTGTALAIFLGLLRPSAYDTVDAVVKDLRMLYCEKAVETADQFEYIARATGKPYDGRVGPSKHYSTGYSGTSYNQGYPQQGLFTGLFDTEEHTPGDSFGAQEAEKITTTSEQDLEMLIDAHASDLGLRFDYISENGFHWYVLVDEATGDVEEFDALNEVADFMQLDAIYSY